jgi:hypothetical protein
MKGFRSAPSLASEFGGKVTSPDQIVPSTFSASELLEYTMDVVQNPAIIQTPRTASKLLAGFRDRKHEVLPDIFVGDVKHQALIKDLVAELEREVPTSDTVNSVLDARGVPGGWSTLFTAPGRPMQPMGYPICNNRVGKLADLKLSERHEQILRELIKAMFGSKWQPKNGYEISKKSSSGFPLNEYDVEAKVDMFKTVANNFNSIAKLVDQNRLAEAAEKYGVLLLYYINRRNQNDKVGDDGPKDRSSPSVGQSAGFEPGVLMAGREIEDLDGFYRTRSRVVYASNGPLNYFWSALLQPVRDHYLSRFSFTWKHTGAEDLERKLKGWIPIGVDASQFDQNFPTEVAEVIFDEMENYFAKDVVKMMKLMWSAPAFCPSPVPDQPDQWACFGHPFDLDTFRAHRGLPSGVAYNPDFGKIWGTAYLLMMLDDLFHDVLEVGVERILSGLHPGYAILNQGDDAIILTRSVEIRDQIKDLLDSGDASPYIDLEVEKFLTFLGWVVTQNGSEYRVYPNIVSMIVNFLGHEHPIGRARDTMGHRKHWALGVEAWSEVFSGCPEYRKVREIFNKVLITHLGSTIEQIARPYALESKQVLKLSGLTADEARFLEKPERRFYSIDRGNLRPELLEDVVRTISPDEMEQYCSKYIQPSYK